ncbi:hypothetical protein PPERSA_00572 [Pseudocohnilembus persalinus]|uniref:CWH43-like N-terminal domain-containing protein n=1 Tax=Pseudocohnilembus persalinus TaxID=266149 RepID=A0A0V0QSU7_PSEPJ|nr:hypothetical protein PPERSA_00572 [Pseudocohnilembus persalinus]|eukprot:KRX05271.1 hypothetical protein PPERSA_00572 [Pseudocohnilembus persalinus]
MLVRYTGKEDLQGNKANKILAGFRLKYLPLILSVSISIGALICYYVAAILQHSVKPFPHNTITGSATNYPQNILFRMLVIPQMGGALLIILAEYYVFKYCAQAYKSRKIPNWWADFLSNCCTLPIMMGISVVSIIMISIAIATIDQGYMNDPLHGASAVIGFLGFYLVMIGITFNYSNLVQIYPDIISQKSLKTKKWLINALVAVLIYVIINPDQMPFYHVGADMYTTSKFTSILEYGIFFIEMGFFYTLYWDYENLYYVFSVGQLENSDLKNIELINGSSFQQQLISNDEQDQQDTQECDGLNQSQQFVNNQKFKYITINSNGKPMNFQYV